jgi:hypothetical protein
LSLHPQLEAARHNLSLAVQARIATGNGGHRGNGGPGDHPS